MSYTINGIVVSGKGLARKLGFPTANVHVTCNMKHGAIYPPPSLPLHGRGRKKFLPSAVQGGDKEGGPGAGVYVADVTVSGKTYRAAVVVGMWQEEHGPSLEAHLLDFTGNLLGQTVQIKLGQFIRPLRKFSSDAELVKQIKDDIKIISK